MRTLKEEPRVIRVVCVVRIRGNARTLSQSRLTTSRLAEDSGASLADDNGLGVREDGGDGEATGALDVHEEGSRGGHEGLIVMLDRLS